MKESKHTTYNVILKSLVLWSDESLQNAYIVPKTKSTTFLHCVEKCCNMDPNCSNTTSLEDSFASSIFVFASSVGFPRSFWTVMQDSAA